MRVRMGVAAAAFFSLITTGCMDQYDPSGEHALFQKEQENANAVRPSLTDEGALPVIEQTSSDSAAASGSPIDQKYNTFCASCHGLDGAASTPAAQAMNPKPRNLTDSDWQASVTDDHIATVIRDGGSAVGLSATMAPWGSVLSAEELKEMVGKVRAFGK